MSLTPLAEYPRSATITFKIPNGFLIHLFFSFLLRRFKALLHYCIQRNLIRFTRQAVSCRKDQRILENASYSSSSHLCKNFGTMFLCNCVESLIRSHQIPLDLLFAKPFKETGLLEPNGTSQGTVVAAALTASCIFFNTCNDIKESKVIWAIY